MLSTPESQPARSWRRFALWAAGTTIAVAGCGGHRPAALEAKVTPQPSFAQTTTPNPATTPLPDGDYFGKVSPTGLTPTSFNFFLSCMVRSNALASQRGKRLRLAISPHAAFESYAEPSSDPNTWHGQDEDWTGWAYVVRHTDPRRGPSNAWYVTIQGGEATDISQEGDIGTGDPHEDDPCYVDPSDSPSP